MWLKIAYLYPAIGFDPKPLAIHHLNIPQSISDRRYSGNLYIDLIRRHLSLAIKNNRLDNFKPCATFLLRQWTRSMLFDARKEDIRKIINEFSNLLPTGYKFLMKLLTIFPKPTAVACRIISRLVRIFKIRKKAFRKPKPEN